MFKRVFSVIGAVLILAVAASADTWKFDMPHSSVGFTVRHLVIAKVNGEFKDFDGAISFDGENVESGSADVAIQMASVDTENEKRDEHLRSPDFFDAEKFPAMTFKSKKIVKGEDSNYKMTGDLTIRDVTKEVTLDVEFNGSIVDPWGGTRAGFSATGAIDRQDFGVKWNKPLETGGFLVSDQVIIKIEAELVKVE
jgi:polyisoprenoid-binding protein YceI